MKLCVLVLRDRATYQLVCSILAQHQLVTTEHNIAGLMSELDLEEKNPSPATRSEQAVGVEGRRITVFWFSAVEFAKFCCNIKTLAWETRDQEQLRGTYDLEVRKGSTISGVDQRLEEDSNAH